MPPMTSRPNNNALLRHTMYQNKNTHHNHANPYEREQNGRQFGSHICSPHILF